MSCKTLSKQTSRQVDEGSAATHGGRYSRKDRSLPLDRVRRNAKRARAVARPGRHGRRRLILLDATGVSVDGRTIIGAGYNPADVYEGWIATVPDPSSLAIAVGAGMSLIGAAASRRPMLRRKDLAVRRD
jgi:hypothetical protein